MTLSEAWVDFLAGWASGAMAVLTCQPVDTVLTRLQAGNLVSGAATSAGGSNISVQTKSLVDNFGVKSLWRGSSAMISAVPMQNSLLMGGYGVGKQWASQNNSTENETLVSVFVGGCTGGVVQSFLMTPVELMKVQQQVIAPEVSARNVGMQVLRGLRSPNKSWRGLNATLMRDGIPHGVWFMSYEWSKTFLGKRLEGTTGESLIVPLTSGAIAATVAWVSDFVIAF